ncbi:MAG: hypothetical protein AB8V23_04965 [Candidatus Midichloria sp.]|uniref:Sodium:solute symporter family protein n=1 Tax=Hyalomma marginatum TaxID=34627 RepID=A0A8S4C3J3_9ACAR|nr:sodium:solute symporter family protein [Hyalomma marginatum]
MAKVYGENINQFRDHTSVSNMMEMLYGKAGLLITNNIELQ